MTLCSISTSKWRMEHRLDGSLRSFPLRSQGSLRLALGINDSVEWIDEFCEWRVYESRREALDVPDGPHRRAASACNRASVEAHSEAVLDSAASLRVLQLPHRESDV